MVVMLASLAGRGGVAGIVEVEKSLMKGLRMGLKEVYHSCWSVSFNMLCECDTTQQRGAAYQCS